MRRKLDKAEVSILKQDLGAYLQSPNGLPTKIGGSPRAPLALFGYLSIIGNNAIVYENTDTKQYEYDPGTDLEPVATDLWSRKED